MKFREIFQAFIATFVIFSCIAFFYIITLNIFPNIDMEGVRQVLPIFNTTFSLLIGFYFGSAMTSKSKDETISNLTNSPPQPNTSVQKTETIVTKTEGEKKDG